MASAVTVLALGSLASQAQAQIRPGQDPNRGERADGTSTEESTRAPRVAPLRRSAAAGPCPYVKILYDAARYVELTGDRVAAANVGFTGEIEGLTSNCAYQGDEPIQVDMRTLFQFGRGPMAEGAARTYRYWIAVTERNKAVLDKQYFDVPVTFTDGAVASETVEQTIMIPRANGTVGGSNFEVLIGFDITPAMAEFNRTGSRFRVNAGGAPVAEPAAQ